jgi:hypothetical protein
MPEKDVLEWIGGTVVTAIGGWLAWLTTSRVPQKQFDQYKEGHVELHEQLCGKLDRIQDTVERIESHLMTPWDGNNRRGEK